jgi:3'-phosphoadenosine 5'-phosphosulfate sulfotransferase (PAPS reductase)/FAD synthetase
METLSSETKALLRDRKVIASVSGGKDSAAMSLWLTENGIEHERVFCDTGWEHPDTYRYLDEVLEPKLGRIERLKPERDFVQLVVHKGMFPSRTRRFCTSELKVKPLARYLNARMDADGDLVNAVGIRAGESAARAKMPAWEWQESFDCEVWRPLLSWSEEDVIACHTRHGLRPNPLYLRGRGYPGSAAGRACSCGRTSSGTWRRWTRDGSIRSANLRRRCRPQRKLGTRSAARRSSRSATCGPRSSRRAPGAAVKCGPSTRRWRGRARPTAGSRWSSSRRARAMPGA